LTLINSTSATAAPVEIKAVDTRVSKSATRDIKASIERLREVRALIKPLEEEAKAITADILAWTTEHNVKRIMWGKTQLALIVKNVNRTNSPAILKQGFPEAYTASLVEKPFEQIR
jgi:hypothetical protein